MTQKIDDDDVLEGLRLTGVAVLAAVVTAAGVIGLGGAVLSDERPAPKSEPAVIRVSDAR